MEAPDEDEFDPGQRAANRIEQLAQRRRELAGGQGSTDESVKSARLHASEALDRALRAHASAAVRHDQASIAHEQAATLRDRAAATNDADAAFRHHKAADRHRSEADKEHRAAVEADDEAEHPTPH